MGRWWYQLWSIVAGSGCRRYLLAVSAVGLHPQTVATWLKRARFEPRRSRPRGSILDPFSERVVAAIEAGQTRVQVAKLYNMALSTVGGFIKRKRETGRVSPDKFGGYKTFALEPHTALVKKLVAEQPDSTLAELQVRLAKEEVKVSHRGFLDWT